MVNLADEPIRYTGGGYPDMDKSRPDGRLAPVLGVHNYQVLRANRAHPDQADGLGNTYNHAPLLAFWRGRFYLSYISAPVHEIHPDPANRDPVQTLLTTSKDGRNWDPPRLLFPAYTLPDGRPTVAHQRMGWYVSPADKRLLAVGFYGRYPFPNDGTGVGRTVREIRPNGTLGPIYFVRYNRHAGWNETNTPHPFYRTATNAGFVAACDALLADKLQTQQWWEEDRANDDFFALAGTAEFSAKALSWTRRKDGTVVGLWKGDWAALSSDAGHTWSAPVRTPSVPTGGSKAWIERTRDGRFALAFNADADHKGCRWPLALLDGEDGETFDRLRCVHGEMSVARFAGRYKDHGPQYVRGIENEARPGSGRALWLAYSVNKEDLWVSRVPIPVRDTQARPVHDDFSRTPIGHAPEAWNVYSPLWASVAVVDWPAGAKCLCLRDCDPYDYARAERLFAPARRVAVGFDLLAGQNDGGRLEIEVASPHGGRALLVTLTDRGEICARSSGGDREIVVGRYTSHQWLDVTINVDAEKRRCTLTLGGRTILADAPFADDTRGQFPHRLTFRTGTPVTIRRLDPFDPYDGAGTDRPAPDEPVRLAEYFIRNVHIAPARDAPQGVQ